MRRFALAATTALACVMMVSTALAHDHRGRGDRGDREWRSEQRYERGYRDGRRDARRDERRHHRSERREWRGGPPVIVVPGPRYGPPPHVGPRHHGGPRWSRGDRLPSQYRQPHYVVHDWRSRHFREPPRGYQWMNVGAEYLLVGIATGVILQAITGR